MGDVHPLPRRQEVFADERGVGLRITWHPERELVVLSIWHDAVCTASFRLPIADLPRLSSLLSAVLGDWAGDVLAARPEGAAPDQRSGAAPAANGRLAAAGGADDDGSGRLSQNRFLPFRLRLPRRPHD